MVNKDEGETVTYFLSAELRMQFRISPISMRNLNIFFGNGMF